MNYSIIPLFLILASLSVIIVLIFRKFSQLTILDVGSIQAVKESKKKDELLKKRADKKVQEAQEERARMLAPVWKKNKRVAARLPKIRGASGKSNCSGSGKITQARAERSENAEERGSPGDFK